MHDMHAMKAQVRNGHLVLVDSLADEMDPEERAEFLRELEISAAEADAGQLIDAADVLAKLRSPRKSRSFR